MLQSFLDKLGPRRDSMSAVIAMLPDCPVICETGCVRQADNWLGDGGSTLIWNAFVEERSARAFSVDNDLAAVELAQKLCPRVRVSHSDSVAYLSQLSLDHIDLLYLDSRDFSTGYEDQVAAALHCMHEFTAATHCRPKFVMVDDTVQIGKHFFG